MDRNEAQAAYAADVALHEKAGVYIWGASMYLPDEFRADASLAMDSLPTTVTDPNSAVPAMLTNMIDPKVYKVLFTPNKAVKIATEERKGSWVDDTAMFPVVEHVGEVSSYGDFVENGSTGVNMNWPQRQSYLYQTMKVYGERELDRAGLAKINWVSEIDVAAAVILDKFQNVTYFYGVQGLQNYGILNDPNLSASISPATKTAGGARWITAGGVINATANEVFNDVAALFAQLVKQSGGLIEKEDELILAMSPTSAIAMDATNSFGLTAMGMIKKAYPNLRIETAIQYGAYSATNPQGNRAGELVQMIAPSVEGQRTLFCAYNEKMRTHKLVPDSSSWKQKITAGTWGCVYRQTFSTAFMLGV